MLSPIGNVGNVARKATEKVSAGRSTSIRINPNPTRLDKGTDTQKDQKDSELARPKKDWPL